MDQLENVKVENVINETIQKIQALMLEIFRIRQEGSEKYYGMCDILLTQLQKEESRAVCGIGYYEGYEFVYRVKYEMAVQHELS